MKKDNRMSEFISCIYIKLYEFCSDAFYERFIGPE